MNDSNKYADSLPRKRCLPETVSDCAALILDICCSTAVMMATPDRYLGISSHPESHECAGFNFEKSYSEFTRSKKVHFSFARIFGPQAPGLVPLDLGRGFTQNRGVNASGTVIWTQIVP